MQIVRRFRYRRVKNNGELAGFLFASQATLSSEGLALEGFRVSASSLLSAEARDNRVALVHVDGDNQQWAFTLEVYGVKAEQIAKELNRVASASRIEARRQELVEHGEGHRLRVETCPNCGGAVDLSDFEISRETFCPHCGNVASPSVNPEEQGRVRSCIRCGLFGFPHGFTCYYVFVVDTRWSRKHLCGPCVRAEAWKALTVNLPFVLGTPIALFQVVRAYAVSAMPGNAYKGLEVANRLARKRGIECAVPLYDDIIRRTGGSAIVSYNKAVGFARANRMQEASSSMEEALIQCSNFGPAARMLAACRAKQGLPVEDHPLIAPFAADRVPESRNQEAGD